MPKWLRKLTKAYEQETGRGPVTRPHPFGRDPLVANVNVVQERDHQFWNVHLPQLHERFLNGHYGPVPQVIRNSFIHDDYVKFLFGATANGHLEPLKKAILLHIKLTGIFRRRL